MKKDIVTVVGVLHPDIKVVRDVHSEDGFSIDIRGELYTVKLSLHKIDIGKDGIVTMERQAFLDDHEVYGDGFDQEIASSISEEHGVIVGGDK
jgi:hypothetical protein